MSQKPYDCIVIGAGPAGLSASLMLARYRRHVLTFHYYSPRNIYSHGVHCFLGHHGILPLDLLARGREEVTLHGGMIQEACVMKAELIEEGFRVYVSSEDVVQRSLDTRRILLATGLRDFTPDCEGFSDFYGSTVFHCPDCDGFEFSDKRIVVLGHGRKTAGFTLNLMTWTDKLALVTNGIAGDMTDEHREKLGRFHIPIYNRQITRLEGDKKQRRLRRVILDDGSALECEALFFNLGTEPASNLHSLLGCAMDEESGLVLVDEAQQTSVPGVYAAGDLTPRSQMAVVAAAEGAMAAVHIHKSLIPDEQKI
jgi:thioredoxin reductase